MTVPNEMQIVLSETPMVVSNTISELSFLIHSFINFEKQHYLN